LRPVCRLGRPAGAELERGPLGDLEGHDLAEPPLRAQLERDVRAGLHGEPEERRLVGEAAPVDRGRERQDLLLELPADGPVAVDALV
jgi:hypothetical protein